jgi:hypothetical protein
MTLATFDKSTRAVAGKAASAESHCLIDANTLANNRGFTDDDTRAMVDKETAADLRGGPSGSAS